MQLQQFFDEFQNKNISFDDVTDKIKKIIIKNFKDNNSTDTLLQSINNISCDIISSSFNKEKLFSGNLDARKIRQTSEMYGFSCNTNAKKTKNGSDLLRVKTNRNDLAHGFKSFEEVGRNATADELLEIQKRVICYLREILENIEIYLSKQDYLK
ncbi:MAE_28990/MAE_18760 family HEPN-like nuclease [Nostoc piscinale]|uniref:MAE_28990/MAE_18760 family HEPN-like nuclease n=1 Tax=Nostoc piscinale TaxID=224012 RepID=UPI000AF45214|nr:MAE_28990/MAE_18760 family HEPN-like nuclease [Nostoc piscinale]